MVVLIHSRGRACDKGLETSHLLPHFESMWNCWHSVQARQTI